MTLICRFMSICPFMASMAASEASKESNATKPKPLDAPVLSSRWTFGVVTTTPNALNVSYSSCGCCVWVGV